MYSDFVRTVHCVLLLLLLMYTANFTCTNIYPYIYIYIYIHQTLVSYMFQQVIGAIIREPAQ